MKLAIFDVDGTLSDSQDHIMAAMEHGFTTLGLPKPSREATLAIVGLSLPEGLARLLPDATEEQRAAVVAHYRDSYRVRRSAEPAPLYPGAADLLDRLAGHEDLLMALATGKSRRGLTALCAHHGIGGYFCSQQVADDHPSKPHPSMVLTALREAGVDACDAVMVGDTTFDIEMGRAAGVATIGVSWGYHPVADLRAAGADRIVADFDELETVMTDMLWGRG